MQDYEFTRTAPNTQTTPDVAPQPLTTAFTGRFCDQCRKPLTGRKEKFCSDGCRMRHRRAEHQEKIAQSLAAVEQAIAGLRTIVLAETKV